MLVCLDLAGLGKI